MPKPTIRNLRLSKDGQRAMKNIQRVRDAGRILKGVLKNSVFIILVSGHPVDNLLTVYTTDWKLLAKAVGKIDVIIRRKIRQIIELQLTENMSRKEQLFWENLLDSI